MLYTKIQPQNFLGSGEDLKVFLPYMDKASILFNGAKSYHHIIIRFLINVQVQGQHPHQWASFQIVGLLHAICKN